MMTFPGGVVRIPRKLLKLGTQPELAFQTLRETLMFHKSDSQICGRSEAEPFDTLQPRPTSVVQGGEGTSATLHQRSRFSGVYACPFLVRSWLSAAALALSANARCQVDEREDSESAERQQWVGSYSLLLFRLSR
jgi:hypothetical protein